jgi:hypothetical protein
MNFRNRQYITKSNGFSLPLLTVLGHPHIGVLRFAYAAPLPHLENDFQLDRLAERKPCDALHKAVKRRRSLTQRST